MDQGVDLQANRRNATYLSPNSETSTAVPCTAAISSPTKAAGAAPALALAVVTTAAPAAVVEAASEPSSLTGKGVLLREHCSCSLPQALAVHTIEEVL